MSNFNIVNPVAQSFFIEVPCFVTKIQLFFQAKDSTAPVVLNLRKNVNGFPSEYVIPFSEVLVPARDIKTSVNAGQATDFVFDAPIFLEEGEYSFTVYSASSSNKLWISELDGVDVLTEKRITEQPYVGVLYKSSNAKTFEPIQSQDIKFNLYIAMFDTSRKGVLEFEPAFLNTQPILLETDPLEMYPSSSVMRVYHKNSGFIDGSYVRLNGIANVYTNGVFTGQSNIIYGVEGNLIENAALVVSNVTSDSYTVVLSKSSNTSHRVRFGGDGVYAEEDITFSTVYPILTSLKNDGTVDHFLKGTGSVNDYVVDSDFVRINERSDTDFDHVKRITSNVNTQNRLSNASSFTYKVEFSTANPFVSPVIDLSRVGMVVARNLINNPSEATVNLIYDTSNVAVSAQANVYQVSGNIGLISLKETADIANARTILRGTQINITGTNLNNGVYRVIDVIQEGGNIRVFNLNANVVTEATASNTSPNTFTIVNRDKFVFEEAAKGGSAYSKYITRQINFINPSTSINILCDVSRPAGNLEFYYKTKLVGEQELLSEKEFVKIENFPMPTTNVDQFVEVKKQLDSLEPFDSLILKIVFLGSNVDNGVALPPKVKNLRVIVLQ